MVNYLANLLAEHDKSLNEVKSLDVLKYRASKNRVLIGINKEKDNILVIDPDKSPTLQHLYKEGGFKTYANSIEINISNITIPFTDGEDPEEHPLSVLRMGFPYAQRVIILQPDSKLIEAAKESIPNWPGYFPGEPEALEFVKKEWGNHRWKNCEYGVVIPEDVIIKVENVHINYNKDSVECVKKEGAIGPCVISNKLWDRITLKDDNAVCLHGIEVLLEKIGLTAEEAKKGQQEYPDMDPFS